MVVDVNDGSRKAFLLKDLDDGVHVSPHSISCPVQSLQYGHHIRSPHVSTHTQTRCRTEQTTEETVRTQHYATQKSTTMSKPTYKPSRECLARILDSELLQCQPLLGKEVDLALSPLLQSLPTIAVRML